MLKSGKRYAPRLAFHCPNCASVEAKHLGWEGTIYYFACRRCNEQVGIDVGYEEQQSPEEVRAAAFTRHDNGIDDRDPLESLIDLMD